MATSEKHNSLQKTSKNFAWATIKPMHQGGICNAVRCLTLAGKELFSQITELMEQDLFNGMRNTEQVQKQHLVHLSKHL